MAVSKLVRLLYKMGMDGWDDILKDFDARTEKKSIVMLRIKDSVYKEFKKACGGKVAEALEVLMLKFVSLKKQQKKSQPPRP